jgi:mannose-6-phosphate isomerase-like protein (cupin superfamily)
MARPLVSVIRKSDRLRFPNLVSEESPSYFFESLDYPIADRKMEAFYAEFPMRSKPSEPHQHDGIELIYVIKGQLAVNIGGEVFTVNEGDAIYFDSGAPHSYSREGRSLCSAMIVVAPE